MQVEEKERSDLNRVQLRRMSKKRKRQGSSRQQETTALESPLGIMENREGYEKRVRRRRSQRGQMCEVNKAEGWTRVDVSDSFLRGNRESGFLMLEQFDGDPHLFIPGENEQLTDLLEEGKKNQKQSAIQPPKRKREKNQIEDQCSRSQSGMLKRGVVLKIENKDQHEDGKVELKDTEKPFKADKSITSVLKKKRKRKRNGEVSGFAKLSFQLVDKDIEEKANETEFIQGEKEEKRNIENSWAQYGFCEELLRGIATCRFVEPTPIQKAIFSVALPLDSSGGCDVIGAAETGSGLFFSASFSSEILFNRFSSFYPQGKLLHSDYHYCRE